MLQDTGAPETKEELPTTAEYDDASQAELESAFIVIEQKCRTKDQIITALANELRLRSQSGRFEELLNKLSKEEAMIPEPRDFDRDQLCQYLRKPDGYVSQQIAAKIHFSFTFSNIVPMKVIGFHDQIYGKNSMK